jgi:hypothetical protein
MLLVLLPNHHEQHNFAPAGQFRPTLMRLKGPYHSSMSDKPAEQATGRGGKRRNSGRKTEVGDKVKKHTVTLDPMTVRKLKVIGEGELSRGIRVAGSYTYDAYQAGKITIKEKP